MEFAWSRERRSKPRAAGAGQAKRTVLEEVNKELWLLLSLFVIAGLLNFLVASNRVLLSLYFLPTLYAAFYYGRRQATLTAVASAMLVALVVRFNPELAASGIAVPLEFWYDLAVWAGTLIVTGYTMGSLYEAKESHIQELRETYHGILIILRQFISKDKYTQNHSYRVSVYASKIATYMGLDPERVEDVHAAALLHDIGKLEISRDILYKAARLSEGEYKEMQRHVELGGEMLKPVGGSLRRILPIVLSHHDKFDGSGYNATQGEAIPLEARIVSVADVYDSLTSDRPYRKAISPQEARDIIVKGSGTDFDPRVVDAFLIALRKGEMEVPDIVV